MSLPRSLFIDVESTGAQSGARPYHRDRHPARRGRRGDHALGEPGRPGQPIPPLIETLVTGISDAMVADAPPFEELADTVAALLDDCVFVAHNARFDYGFIKNEFRASASDFDGAGAVHRQAVARAVPPASPPRPGCADRAPRPHLLGPPSGHGRYRSPAPVCRHRRQPPSSGTCSTWPSSRP
jgi:hypothetical protein